MKYLAIFWGKVNFGKQRGKSLGFPTANIKLRCDIAEGIYISLAKVNGKELPALTFVGASKTFGEKEVRAETYFLTHSADVYGKWLTVRLLKKTRGNKKFTSESELVDQMKRDKMIAEKYFKEKHV